MSRRVVITGIGPVTAIGIGKNEFFSNIIKLKTVVRPVPAKFEKKYEFKSRYYVPSPAVSLSDYGFDSRYESMTGGTTKLSLAAAKLAFEDARLKDIDDGSIILGLGIGSLQTAFTSYLAHTLENVDARFSRMVVPMLMPNSASAWISILFKCQGQNYTINASCASGAYAIGEAYLKIKRGDCPIVLTGGVECLQDSHGGIMRGFDILNTLTGSIDGLPRPFSKNRSGFLFNEGAACILVLEDLQHAKERGASIYAEIIGFETNSDGYNIIQMEPSGAQITKMLKKLIGDKKIDYFNAHGTGTVANDEIEARVIRNIFGNSNTQPFINSTKGIIGHSIGASGALEAAVAALSIKESKIHGNILGEEMDNLNLVKDSLDTPVRYAVSSSYGFGGHNAALLLKRCDEYV